jgi:hypothetical protein
MSPARSVPSRRRRARLATGSGKRTTAVGSPRGRPPMPFRLVSSRIATIGDKFLLQKLIPENRRQRKAAFRVLDDMPITGCNVLAASNVRVVRSPIR